MISIVACCQCETLRTCHPLPGFLIATVDVFLASILSKQNLHSEDYFSLQIAA